MNARIFELNPREGLQWKSPAFFMRELKRKA